MDPAGNMLKWKIADIFKDLPSFSGIADDILFVGYITNGRGMIKPWNELYRYAGKKI